MTRRSAWIAPAGLVVGVTLAAFAADLFSPRTGGVIRLLAGAVVVAALIIGARRNGARGFGAWTLIAVGIGVWVVGDALWDALDAASVPADSHWYDLVNILYLTVYPVIFAAFIRIVRAGRQERSLDNVIDSALLFLAVVLLLQIFVIDPAQTAGTAIEVFSTIYPFGDALLLAGMSWLFLTNARRNPSTWLLASGLVLMLLVDAWWEVSLQLDTESLDIWINALYPVAYALIAAAALHPAVATIGDRAEVSADHHPARLAFLCIALALVPAGAFLGTRDDVLVELCTAALVGAIGVRFAVLVRNLQAANRRAEVSAQRFRSLASAAPVGIIEANGSLEIVFSNKATDRVLGRSAVGMTTNELLARSVDPRDQPVMREVVERVWAGNRASAQCRVLDPQGNEIWLAWSGVPVNRGPGPFTGAFVSTMDITALKEAEELLSLQALHDPLTGLPNRRLLIDRMTAALVRLQRSPGMIAVLFLDLDGFKLVNDRFGHDAGDALLKVVTSRMLGTVRSSDTVARYGGDEFVVVLDRIPDREQAAKVAQKLIDVIALPIPVAGGEVVVSASVGIAVSEDPHEDPDVLVRNADVTMFEAKEEGSGLVRVCEERDGSGSTRFPSTPSAPAGPKRAASPARTV